MPPSRLPPVGSASVSSAQLGSTKHVPPGRLPPAGSASVSSAQPDDTNCTVRTARPPAPRGLGLCELRSAAAVRERTGPPGPKRGLHSPSGKLRILAHRADCAPPGRQPPAGSASVSSAQPRPGGGARKDWAPGPETRTPLTEWEVAYPGAPRRLPLTRRAAHPGPGPVEATPPAGRPAGSRHTMPNNSLRLGDRTR